MASILFDDITFPRELYDPDTFEFVPPVATLLAFTPHILSQLAKPSESEQEPMPIPPEALSSSSSTLPTSLPQEQGNSSRDTKPDTATSSSSSSNTTPSTAPTVFSIFQNIASTNGMSFLENSIHLAGRYAGAQASAKHHENQRENNNRSSNSFFNAQSSSGFQDSYWFGQQNSYHRDRDHEKERLKEMEKKLEQMERDMRHNSAMARSEVESQRRECVKLQQELEIQKNKVKNLESGIEDQRKQEAARIKKQKQKEMEEAEAKEKERKQAEEKSSTETKKSKDDKNEEEKSLLTKQDAGVSSAAILAATVGVASLAMSLYSAHKASATYSVVNFHDQLEELIRQCHGVIQSTEAWISEQFLDIPDQVKDDLKMIKELMDTIQRLDPRSEKKAEAVAWSVSAVGSLGAVGGAVIGSMTAMASGGTVVLGCALFGLINRAKFNGPEYKGAKTTLEMRVANTLRSLGMSPTSATAGSGAGTYSRTYRNRIDRLRIEFERRDGHDLRDADEIDGLVVEDALTMESFSAPFVSQKASSKKTISYTTKTPLLSDNSYVIDEFESFRPKGNSRFDRPHVFAS
ncbi:hypothetical protein BGZ76_009296 [Entomortierella beljakovae]|nr:hypothetical protein BGZ76_009296 [Entomortierella beljakovae]